MNLAIQLLLTVVVAGGGAYFGTYLREKAKNLATKEDMDKILLGQETIKQQLAHSTFVEGRRWELKREVVWDLQKQMGIMRDAAISLNAASRAGAGDVFAERRQEALDRLLAAALQATTLRAIAGSLIEDPAGERLDDAVRECSQGLPRESWLSQEEFERLANRIHTGILGVQVVARTILFDEPLAPAPISPVQQAANETA